MRHPIIQAPEYPPFVLGPNVLPAAAEELRPLISHGARHDAHNGFEAEGSEKFGRPVRHRLALIHVGDAFEGVPEAETRTGSLHILFETEEGERFGINRCKPGYRPTPQEGILLKDRHGRAWFCQDVPADGVVQTRPGKGRLRPVPLATAPRLRDAHLQGADLADRIPAAGRFLFGPQDLILGVDGEWGKPDAGALALAEARVERLVAREDRIRAIAERNLQPGALDGLKLGRGYPITDGFIPPYHAFDAHKAFDEALFAVTRALLEDLRREGLLTPCPNNGPRAVSSIEAWNRWLEGAYDAPPDGRPREDRWGKHSLADAPGFKTFQNCLFRQVVDTERKIWERDHPEDKRGFGEAQIPLGEAEVDEMLKAACARIITAYAQEDTNDNIGFMDLRSQQTGDALVLQNSFLNPVLCARPKDYRSEPVPLPPVDAPSSVRHLELSLPSGVLCMADWFRIDGFKEGLQSLLGGEDHYEINYATGLDARAKDYFEKAGLVIVQVGNTSPAAYADTPGVWRMGYVDEDHEIFWDEAGEPVPGTQPPAKAWRTCTDLWANTFADREVIVDILMASDRYPDRADALMGLTEYAQEYGVSMTDLGVDRLHLYLPTGQGIHAGDFNEVFRAAELDPAAWREDVYVLSATPLTVDPGILEDCDWVERPATQPMTEATPGF
jgi:hypothetical protein